MIEINFRMPDFIKGDKVAESEFKRMSKELSELDPGFLTNIDNIQLGMYCRLFSIYKQCLADEQEKGLFTSYTNKGGSENVVEAPWSKLRRATETQIMMLSKSFGLSPLDRRKFKDCKPEQIESDEFAEFDR